MTLKTTTQKTLGATLAAVALAGGLMASSAPAEARNGRNTALVAGAIGGLAVGALIAGSARPAYAAPAPVYVAPQPVYVQPRCYIERERLYDSWGNYAGSRRVRVCH